MRTIILFFFALLIAGCTGKQVTVKSLHPSLIPDKKIYHVILEEFRNDRINQTNYLEEKLVNKIVDNQRVFKLEPSYDNIDAILTGEVLESSLYYDFYYDEEIDYHRCRKYKYVDGKRTNKCLRHKIRRIPCERRTYVVKTKVDVLDRNESLLFSKIYSKSKHTNQCDHGFMNRGFYPHSRYFNNLNSNRAIYPINSSLARQIAQEAVNDISPHYIYRNITIIEELEDKKYSEIINKEFETIVELLDNGNINVSQTKLHQLNKKLNFTSYEVLYNLALTYEAQDKLSKAKDYYQEAQSICTNTDHLILIDNSINRMQYNLEDKIRAKSQLPNI